MTIIPLAENVVVKLEEKTNKTKGGIILTDDVNKPRHTGTVIAVAESPSMMIQVGDTVIVSFKEAFKTEEEDLWIFPLASILAKIV